MFDIPGAVKSVMDVVGKFVPDTTKLMEIQQQVVTVLVDASAKVMAADAASESWLTRNARPLVVMWTMGMVTWTVISPAFGLQEATITSLTAVPEQLWNLVYVGIGGYMLARTADKGIKALWK